MSVRVALYARVSTSSQDVAMQFEALRRTAAQRQWQVVGEYSDVGVSGAHKERPELNRLMADANLGLFDVVAVWKFDRFARSTAHLVLALEVFRSLGIGFFSYTEAIDTSTPIGKAMFGVIAVMAEFERDMIQERILEGLARARAQGKHCGRPRKQVPLEPALAMLREGSSLRDAARQLKLDRNTLRERLREEGHWPPMAVVSEDFARQTEIQLLEARLNDLRNPKTALTVFDLFDESR